MAEQSWHEARLIPTSGINGAEEQERRATSALLAVLGAVREYGRALLRPFGAPAGRTECFIEVPCLLGDKKLYPDGLIRVSRGSRSWTALVEVKTGSNDLEAEQLENYLDIAREQGFEAVITISNEIPALAGQHPTKVDRRKLRKVDLHHLSWSQVLAEAVMQKEFRGVADPDQAWILGELIRYLEHRRSGALEFDDMGEPWTAVRDAVAAGTLRPADKGIATVVARFDTLLRFASLSLGRRLGTEVVPVLTRKEMYEPSLRAQALTQQLCAAGQLAGAIRIPDTVGPLVVTADLRSGQVTCHVDVDAPRDGRPTTRVNWLVRQLKSVPDTARIECFIAHSRGSSAAELLRVVRENPAALVSDPAREIRSFRVATSSPLGTKRGRGRGAFIDSVLAAIDSFYAEVLGDLKAWSAAPPKMRQTSPAVSDDVEPTKPASLASTDFSSQDGPNEGPSGELTELPRQPPHIWRRTNPTGRSHARPRLTHPTRKERRKPSSSRRLHSSRSNMPPGWNTGGGVTQAIKRSRGEPVDLNPRTVMATKRADLLAIPSVSSQGHLRAETHGSGHRCRGCLIGLWRCDRGRLHVKVGDLARRYAEELSELPGTYQQVRSLGSEDLHEVVRVQAEFNRRDAWFVGSGGAMAMAQLAATVHALRSTRVAHSVTPLSLAAGRGLQISRAAVGLFSARARHPDVRLAARAVRARPSNHVVLLTQLRASDVSPELAAVVDDVLTLPHTTKDGFLATNSIVAMAATWLAAAGFELPPTLPLLQGTTPEWPIDGRRVLVLYSPDQLAAAFDLEARLSETGLLDVQLADLRNMAHGRHVGLLGRASSTVVVTLGDPGSKALVDKTIAVLPRTIRIVDLSTSLRSPEVGRAGVLRFMLV